MFLGEIKTHASRHGSLAGFLSAQTRTTLFLRAGALARGRCSGQRTNRFWALDLALHEALVEPHADHDEHEDSGANAEYAYDGRESTHPFLQFGLLHLQVGLGVIEEQLVILMRVLVDCFRVLEEVIDPLGFSSCSECDDIIFRIGRCYNPI